MAAPSDLSEPSQKENAKTQVYTESQDALDRSMKKQYEQQLMSNSVDGRLKRMSFTKQNSATHEVLSQSCSNHKSMH